MTDMVPAIAASWPDAVAAIDADGRIFWVNERMSRLCPATAGVAAATPLPLGSILAEGTDVPAILRLGLSTGQPLPIRLAVRADGVSGSAGEPAGLSGEHWRLPGIEAPVMMLRLYEQSGPATRFLELTQALEQMNREVRARREAEEILRSAVLEAIRAKDVKDRVLAEVSHDMRTPLNAIIGYSEMMALEMQGPLPEAYRPYVRNVLTSADLLLDIVDLILEAAPRPSRDLESVIDGAVNLGRALEACRLAVLPLATSKGLELLVPEAESLPRVKVLRAKLHRMLLNMLDNAVKFAPPGGRVAVSTERPADDGLRIRIWDNGPGIPEAEIPLVTEPFYRAGGPYTAGAGGYGLGLTMVKRTVDELGASLSIESAPGRGTAVAISLPPDIVDWAGGQMTGIS